MKPGEAAHIRRVAAWCAEITAKLGLPPEEREILKQVVPLYRRSPVVMDPEGWSALRSDLGIAASRTGVPGPQDAAMGVLQSLHGYPASNRHKKLALILEQCADLDAACELDATVSGEEDLSGLDGIISEVGAHFGGAADSEVQKAASRLPVFPAVAYRAIKLLDNVEANLGDLESLVAADQTLARDIVCAANSVVMSSTTRAKTVRQAVTRIGVDAACEIVSAASLKTLFDSKQSHRLWNHSLDVADLAAHIASRSGLVAREEAFLAGLMHDIGKLVILNLPARWLSSCERLTQSGCPGTIVERVIFGQSHAAIGARLLQKWRFAESVTECVENHHTPERSSSPLASIVYLADLQTCEEQELESAWRREWAMTELRLANDSDEAPAHPSLTSLRFAATA
jgi:putative nucleotidyltransferase with HDIG domain